MAEPSKAPRLKSRLGRGLSSLMSISEPSGPPEQQVRRVQHPHPENAPPAESGDSTAAARSTFIEPGVRVMELPLDSIVPNPHQPRREFNEPSLAELAASLKTTGVIQPVIVRADGKGGAVYELIAGERRWRAAKLAKLATLPAIVRDVDGATQAQMALIENIQREDLNPMDRALAYHSLLTQLGLTQGELATRLGEDRTSIAHFLRLLDLDPAVQDLLRSAKLTFGHAKLLAGVNDPAEQRRLANVAVNQSLTLRNLERLIETAAGATAPSQPEPALKASAHLQELERSIGRQLNLRAQVRSSARRKGHGKLILHYTSLDQFDDLMGRLGVQTDQD